MARPLVLLTGATGLVGFRILCKALEEGYAVRCVVQGPGDLRKILATSSIQALKVNDHQLFWTLIHDMAAPGAFKEAVKGARYIFHCAACPYNWNSQGPTSYPNGTLPRDLWVTLSILGILQSADACDASVLRRIVITTSLADHKNQHSRQSSSMPASTASKNEAVAKAAAFLNAHHAAGKLAESTALGASHKLVADKEPSFDVVFLLTGTALGAHELASCREDLEKTPNGAVIRLLTGNEIPASLHGGFVSIHDLAKGHLMALTSERPRSGVFVMSASTTSGPDVLGQVRQKYPQAYSQGTFRIGQQYQLGNLKSETTPPLDDLGVISRSFGDTVLEIAEQFLALDSIKDGMPADPVL